MRACLRACVRACMRACLTSVAPVFMAVYVKLEYNYLTISPTTCQTLPSTCTNYRLSDSTMCCLGQPKAVISSGQSSHFPE